MTTNLVADQERALLEPIVEELHAAYFADRLGWPTNDRIPATRRKADGYRSRTLVEVETVPYLASRRA